VREIALAAIATALLSLPAQAQYLILGGDDMDACASNGVVAGLKPGGGNVLAVRSGPGVSHASFDQLHNGDAVFLCTGEGAWYGIVYGGGRDCGVSSPIVPARTYDGPCKSGWVHRDFIEVTAG
jgi:hypothetical protein